MQGKDGQSILLRELSYVTVAPDEYLRAENQF